MNKIVTYQSPEYYELLALGWVIVAQVSASTVMMAHDGTGFNEHAGPPQENTDPTWAPTWGGVAIPGVAEVPYVASYDWSQVIRDTNPNTSETVTMYKDMLTDNFAGPGISRYTKIEAIDALGVLREQEIWDNRWDDSLFEWNWRLVATAYDTWRAMFSNADKSAQALVPSLFGPVQYRIVYTATGTIHTFATWTLLLAEYNSGILY